MSKFREQVRSYGLAVTVTFFALFVMLTLNPWLQMAQTPFLLFFGAITLSAWYGGLSGHCFHPIICAFKLLFFLPPAYYLTGNLVVNSRLLLFVGQGFLISYLCGALRTAQARTNTSLQQLRASEAEREQLLKALEIERLRLETVLRQMPAGLLIADAASGKLVLANAQVEEILAYPYTLNFQLSDYELLAPFIGYHADGRPYQPQDWPLMRSLQTGEIISREDIKIERSNGTCIAIEVNSAPIRDAQGKIMAAVAIFQDITALQQREAERNAMLSQIQEANALLDTVFNNAPVGIGVWDEELRFVRLNEALAQINGFSPAEHIGKTLMELLPGVNPEVARTFYQVLETGKSILGQETSGETPAVPGKLRTWSVSYYPIHLPGGIKRLGAICEEITERKQAERKLQQQARELIQLNASLSQTTALLAQRNQELDRFAYIVSHDLKAPLRAISNLSIWIEEDLAGQLPDENQQQLTLLRQRVIRLEDLINGLLAYARIGRTEVASETVDVAQLLVEILDSLAFPPAFKIDIQSPMPIFSGKRLLLSQVFSNLISNAINHQTRPDGYIKISAKERGDRYEFAVTDNGLGIAPEYHEKIFEIFQTLDARDTKESTGIGLAIVKKIIEAEGGEIILESQLEQGATFRFTWFK